MIPFTDADVSLMRCPACACPIERAGAAALRCRGCAASFPIEAPGWPRLYQEQEVRGPDRLMRFVYDRLARLHDVGVRYLLPALEVSAADLRGGTALTEERLRRGYLARMELSPGLRPGGGRSRPRILEVGVGTGANVPLVLDALGGAEGVDYFGVDLSRGMMRRCAARLAGMGAAAEGSVRLLMADAHRLPFAARSFDRVFHVGGIAGYRDPAAALSEMARVAAPGTPIVVVDEALDPGRAHSLYHRLGFRLITFYDKEPKSPRPLLPQHVQEVRETWLSRFYYCLSFSTPEAARRPAAGSEPRV